jgi:hypothetical protein
MAATFEWEGTDFRGGREGMIVEILSAAKHLPWPRSGTALAGSGRVLQGIEVIQRPNGEGVMIGVMVLLACLVVVVEVAYAHRSARSSERRGMGDTLARWRRDVGRQRTVSCR